MKREYTNDIVTVATHGLDEIDPEESVKVNLKDLMYVFATLQEFQRFFHQPMHYQELSDVQNYMGSVEENGAYKLLHTAIHQKFRNMLPEHIERKYDEGVFDSPKMPFYCAEK